MPLDFPSSPSNGQVYGAYTYDSTKGAWNVTPQTQASVTTSDTPPVNPVSGDQWFYTVDGTMFVYYDDGTSSQWVEQPKSIAGGYSYYRSPNYIINGAFDIWQRGTSISGHAVYNADRWTQSRTGAATGTTVTRQTASLTGFQYCARVQRASANTSTAIVYHTQSFETVNSLALAEKAVTLSFWARSGANFSAASSTLTANILSSTGTDQNFAAVTLTGQATVATTSVTLTSTWTRFSVTGTVSSSATQVHVQTLFTPVGTAGANDYFEVTGVMLEEGTAATSFRRNAPNIQAELVSCQRYYQVSTIYWTPALNGSVARTLSIQWVTPMRTTPTTFTQNTSGAGTSFAQNGLNSTGFYGYTTTLSGEIYMQGYTVAAEL
jgi:hypothetical protein